MQILIAFVELPAYCWQLLSGLLPAAAALTMTATAIVIACAQEFFRFGRKFLIRLSAAFWVYIAVHSFLSY
ncbi:hypothetical protein [Pseudomonas fluorescens]|uniref:hypothetical protein n=1 Tax=Pseudomonas fluorescens TaxID=294 RepID=UPI00177D4CFC|nr:hypothetical protein [Pseudomonas fluorescens]